MDHSEEVGQVEEELVQELTTKASLSMREQKLKMKEKIRKSRLAQQNAKTADFYREKGMNLSHIKLKKGVEMEEATGKRGKPILAPLR